MQPADFFLVLSLIAILLLKNKKKINSIINDNKLFLIFVILSGIINILYFIMYKNTRFLFSSLYLVFNMMGIIVFTYILDNNKVKEIIKKIFQLNIAIQLGLFLLGLGKYYGFTRYMGTFNDPNQFSFYILVSYVFIYLLSLDLKQSKGNIVFLLISMFLIMESASTGMLLGISCFLLFEILYYLKNVLLNFGKYKYRIFIIIMVFIPLALSLWIINDKFNIIKTDNILIVKRVQEKFTKIETKNTQNVSLIQERGYDRFIYYPQYILYGSGEGEYNRFTLTYHQDEIHATFPSILFYYGIIPFAILLLWLKKKLWINNFILLIPIFALFLESFTLLNQRQLLFWVIIVYVDYLNRKGIGDNYE